MVRGQLPGLRGRQDAAAGTRLNRAAPDQVQEVFAVASTPFGGASMSSAVGARAGVLALGLTLMSPTGLQANDTMAVFGAGGLQFEQTDKLRMEREDLYLSPLEV